MKHCFLGLLILGGIGLAQEPASHVSITQRDIFPVSAVRNQSSPCLYYGYDGLVYIDKKRAIQTVGEPTQYLRVLFTGVHFIKGEDWRAAVTYKDGILNGDVIVWSEDKELYRFRYEKGNKILPETGGIKE